MKDKELVEKKDSIEKAMIKIKTTRVLKNWLNRVAKDKGFGSEEDYIKYVFQCLYVGNDQKFKEMLDGIETAFGLFRY